jgi:hypothetical protein
MDEDGRLSLSGEAEAGDGVPAGGRRDEGILSGWDRSGHVDPWDDCGDGEDGWLRSLPADLRAEVEARPPVSAAAWEAGPAEACRSFGEGGLGDEMLPGWLLGQLLAEATADGYWGLTDDELAGLLRGWQRQVAHDQASLAGAVRCLASRRAAGSSRAAGHVADELAAELTLTGRSAGRQLELSAGLGRLPEVNDALLSGFLDWPRACVFVDELAVLDERPRRRRAAARSLPATTPGSSCGWRDRVTPRWQAGNCGHRARSCSTTS